MSLLRLLDDAFAFLDAPTHVEVRDDGSCELSLGCYPRCNGVFSAMSPWSFAAGELWWSGHAPVTLGVYPESVG